LDESRFSIEEFTAVFEQVGAFGYGKEASSGLGKFALLSIDACDFTTEANLMPI
jgi:CRISPR-associated protein Csm4